METLPVGAVLIGSLSFPFHLYETPDQNGPFFVPMHWQEELEIIYVTRGIIHVEINDRAHSVHAGQIAIVNSFELHSIYGDGATCRYEAFIFPLKSLHTDFYGVCQKEFLYPLSLGDMLFPTLIDENQIYYRACAELLDRMSQLARKRPRGFELGIHGCIFSFLCELAGHDAFVLSTVTQKSDIRKRLQEILQYINSNCSQPIGMQQVASRFGYSSKYFCHLFKQNYGRTFVSYLNKIRIQKAAELLVNTDMRVSEIAEQCGYDNLSYFIRRFKQQMRQTPINYRVQVRLCEVGSLYPSVERLRAPDMITGEVKPIKE